MNKKYSIKKEKVKLITWLISFYLLLAPFDFLPVLPGISMSKILIFIPLMGLLPYLNKLTVRLDRFVFILFLYFITLLTSMFYSYDTTLTKERVISIGLNLVVIIIISMLNYNKTEIGILKKAMAYSGWITLFLIIFYSDRNLMGGRLTVSVNGYYQDPNYLTGFLIFPTIYYIDDFVKNKKIISIFKVIIFFVLVLLTGSRGGLLAILGSSLFYIITWIKKIRFKLLTIIKMALFILFLLIAFNVVVNNLPENISERYSIDFIKNDDASGRTEIWKSIIYNYEQSPNFNKFFGWGSGTIGYFTYNGNVGHNIWLESLIEIGIVGTLILFSFYVIFFRKAIELKDYVISASFLGYMIMTLSLSLYSYKPIWNILLIIMILKNYSINFISKTHLKEYYSFKK